MASLKKLIVVKKGMQIDQIVLPSKTPSVSMSSLLTAAVAVASVASSVAAAAAASTASAASGASTAVAATASSFSSKLSLSSSPVEHIARMGTF